MTLKNKILHNKLTIGSWLSYGYEPICEIMAKSNFDWIVIDLEHTFLDYKEAFKLIQIIDLCGSIPLVRVGKNDDLIIKRVLDSGAKGIIVPMINSSNDAEKAVNSIYYPPQGQRGVGLARAQGYGMGFFEYKSWLESEIILIAQIEHIEGVNNLNTIMEVDGVDGFLIGPYDLSASLGTPGNWETLEFRNAMEKVTNYMNKNNKIGGVHVVHPIQEELVKMIQTGYKFIAYGSDMIFFNEGFEKENKFIKKVMI